MRFREVLGQSSVTVRPRHCAELERRSVREWARDARVVEAAELVELLARDHKRRQVGRVYRQEHHGEHRPHVGHETCCETPR